MAGQQDDKSYQLKGMKLLTSGDLTWGKDELPDWRMVHTAVILPIPLGIFENLDAFRQDQRWLQGRFNGIKSVDKLIFDEAKGIYRAPKKSENEENGYKYISRDFHSSAKNRFSSTVAESVKAGISDSIDGTPCSSSMRMEGENSQECDNSSFFRYQFIKDFTDEPWVDYKAENFFHDDEEELQFSYTVALSEGYKKNNNISQSPQDRNAKVSLAGIEILHFEDYKVHDLGAKDSSIMSHEFLVLHVVSEYCSSELLSAIMGSLNRSRNKVSLRGGDFLQGEDKSLLDYFIHLVNKKIPSSALKDPFVEDPIKVAPGGFIESESLGKAPCRPYRISCAIPAKPKMDFPHILSPELSPESGEDCAVWSSADSWAWMMTTAADRYYSGVPSLDEKSLSESQIMDCKYWLAHASVDGIAVVRKSDDLSYDMGLCMVTPTRYVDLALLVLRATAYLSHLSAQLRNIVFDAEEIKEKLREFESGSMGSPEREKIAVLNKKLSSYRDSFEDIQSDLITFRDNLWFEGAQKYPLDSKILRGMQKNIGAYDSFQDIKSELSLRKSVYDTQHQSLNFLLRDYQDSIQIREEQERIRDRERREEIRQAEEKRDQEMRISLEENRKEEEQHRQEMNDLLAVAALFLSVPGLIALWPNGSSIFHFVFGLAFLILFFLYMAFVLFFKKRKKVTVLLSPYFCVLN